MRKRKIAELQANIKGERIMTYVANIEGPAVIYMQGSNFCEITIVCWSGINHRIELENTFLTKDEFAKLVDQIEHMLVSDTKNKLAKLDAFVRRYAHVV